MTTLLCLQLLGFLFSLSVHLLLLLDYSFPCNLISIAIQVVMVALFGIRVIVTKPLRQGKDWYWDKSLKEFLPRWLKVTAILVFTYLGASCVFFLKGFVSRLSVGMTAEDSEIAKINFNISLFAIIALCFAMESLMGYLYRAKKIKLKESKSEELLAAQSMPTT